ncbi:hypothetical protein [Candidatus Thalassolituus haligoni]|uniref:hypothetical protein n=1 Tax=Candidatus Thalassolituus haligoni TaxID=3100113 RepID=UPI0035195542|tara:strand:- start:33884 stop:34699 length:816 start_codon:yes stop_codon:yes gene_type:complete
MKSPVSIAILLMASSCYSAASEAAMRSQGDWYGYWGWNNATYSDSDIHFEGDDYDFTLHNVSAKDHQTQFSIAQIFHSYLNPGRITIPQYNWRFGYFVQDNWSVSLGWDHMKYVMVQDQTVSMTGTNDRNGFEKTDPAAEDVVLTEDFLTYEHTDGFNQISLETEAYLPVWQHGADMDIALFAGAGAGIMYPKSNVKLMSGDRNDEWHVAGYSTLVKIGVEANVWQGLFVRFIGKYGYVNMNDVLTSHDSSDKARQKIYYDEYIGAIGYRF